MPRVSGRAPTTASPRRSRSERPPSAAAGAGRRRRRAHRAVATATAAAGASAPAPPPGTPPPGVTAAPPARRRPRRHPAVALDDRPESEAAHKHTTRMPAATSQAPLRTFGRGSAQHIPPERKPYRRRPGVGRHVGDGGHLGVERAHRRRRHPRGRARQVLQREVALQGRGNTVNTNTASGDARQERATCEMWVNRRARQLVWPVDTAAYSRCPIGASERSACT